MQFQLADNSAVASNKIAYVDLEITTECEPNVIKVVPLFMLSGSKGDILGKSEQEGLGLTFSTRRLMASAAGQLKSEVIA